RISGPLLDRIDIQIEASPVVYEDLKSINAAETSASIRKRVNQARKIQSERFEGLDIHANSELNPTQIKKYCRLTKEAEEILKISYKKLSLSVRAYTKIIKVARTIADMDGCTMLEMRHIAEAIQYRNIDKKFWG
ncbi:MAG: magnesium chelatase, partial [Dethiosulfatibacter sp.]|nr:magnesium chelatase [Dethiosulfatibacter sp.]